MAHRSEQGNVLGFVLVGALLVATLLGGIYVVRHSAQQGGGTNVATTDESDNKATAPGDSADNAKNTDNNETQQSGTSGSTSSGDSLKDALDKQSSNQTTTQSSSTSSSSSSETTSSSAASLPQTGPADTFAMILGAVLLTGTGFAYAQSRRLI